MESEKIGVVECHMRFRKNPYFNLEKESKLLNDTERINVENTIIPYKHFVHTLKQEYHKLRHYINFSYSLRLLNLLNEY